MSIFSSIGKAIEKQLIVPVANVVGSAISKVTGASYQKQTAEKAFSSSAGKVYTTILGGSAVAAAVGVASIPSVAKAIIPATTKGKIIGTAATLVVGSAALKSEKTADAIFNTPSSLVNFGGNIGELIEDPSYANVKKIVEENPVLSAATAAGAIIGVGAGVGGLVASAVNTQATRANTAALQSGQVQTLELPSNQVAGGDSVLQTDTSQIKTPATQSISSRKRKRSKSKKTDGVRQSVRINIVNTGMKVQNKRYLNMIPIRN